MPKPMVKKSNTGLGLFANQFYRKGDFIIEYTGETVTEDEANLRGGKYLFQLNEHSVIDGKSRENLSRYINHSCRPNAYPEINEHETRIRIYAKKKISPGDEITYHYGTDYFKRILKPAGCRCEKCTIQS